MPNAPESFTWKGRFQSEFSDCLSKHSAPIIDALCSRDTPARRARISLCAYKTGDHSRIATTALRGGPNHARTPDPKRLPSTSQAGKPPSAIKGAYYGMQSIPTRSQVKRKPSGFFREGIHLKRLTVFAPGTGFARRTKAGTGHRVTRDIFATRTGKGTVGPITSPRTSWKGKS